MKKIMYSLLLLGTSFNVFGRGNPCTGPQPNLVAHWEFTAGNLTESINGWPAASYVAGTTTPSTLTNVPGRDGTPNTAVRLIGQYIKVPYQAAMNLTSWTITAVVEIDDWNVSTCQGNAIFWRGAQFGPNHYDLQFFDNAYDNDCNKFTGVEVFATNAAGSCPFPQTDWLNNLPSPGTSINPILSVHKWYCVTATYDATTQQLDLYVENHHVFSKNYPYGYGAPSADDLFIGCSDNPLGPNIYNFFGRIDDIKLYDGAMYCPPALVELCAQCNSQMPAPTPVAHWGFDGNNGNNPYVDDINGLVGVPTGTPVSAPGQNGLVNTALHFNGIGDYIQVASSPILDLQSWTIRAVFKPDGFYAGSCQGNIIVKRGAQFGPNHYSLLFTDNIYDNNNCTATVDPYHENITAGAAGVDPMPTSAWLNGPATSPTNQYIAAGQWYCVTASYDGVAGRMRLFVDGMLVYDNLWNNQYGPPAIEDLFIGGDNTINPYYFNGTIDDIAIYDGATDCAMSCRNAFNGQPKIANGVNKVNGRSSLAITPNPATNEVKITTPASWGKTTWTLTNSAGQVLQTGEIKANTTQAVINVSNLPVGMYILKAEHGTSSEYQKLIKN